MSLETWTDYPEYTLALQKAWDRKMKAWKLRKAGLKLGEIGKIMGCSATRASSLFKSAERRLLRGEKSPCEAYVMRGADDLRPFRTSLIRSLHLNGKIKAHRANMAAQIAAQSRNLYVEP